jgi:hypothetical protein
MTRGTPDVGVLNTQEKGEKNQKEAREVKKHYYIVSVLWYF